MYEVPGSVVSKGAEDQTRNTLADDNAQPQVRRSKQHVEPDGTEHQEHEEHDWRKDSETAGDERRLAFAEQPPLLADGRWNQEAHGGDRRRDAGVIRHHQEIVERIWPPRRLHVENRRRQQHRRHRGEDGEQHRAKRDIHISIIPRSPVYWFLDQRTGLLDP